VLCFCASTGGDVSVRPLRTHEQVREFSDQAKFKNPTRSVVMPDVVCASNLCSAVRDIDLCREADVIESVTRVGNGGVQAAMRCHQCHHEYDAVLIEQRLVESLHQVAILASHRTHAGGFRAP
jgi:DNA polymerase epsilon subunit 1